MRKIEFFNYYQIVCAIWINGFLSILSLNINFKIKEQTAKNQRIGSIKDQLPVSLLKFHNDLEFISMNTKKSQFFSIDKFNGDVKIVKSIDREELCHSNKYCKIDFTVNCLQKQNIAEIIEVAIFIEDINDNGCAFIPSAHQMLSWREDSRINETLESINRPKDNDINFSILKSTIHIKFGSEFFRLRITPTGSLEAPFNLELILKSELDYEKSKQHFIVIEASDGQQDHACELNLTVSVIDINDNNPRFTNESYSISVPENHPLNKSLIQLHATDRDSGIHGEIYYYIDMYADQNIKNNFFLERTTGELFLKKELSWYQCKQYLLTIEARNVEIRSKFGLAKLSIKVIDINNEIPEITLRSSITGISNLTIEENQSTEKDVAMVTVTDKDAGMNAKVNCLIKSQSVPDIIELRDTTLENTFRLVIIKRIDRELINKITGILVCSDLGQPSLTRTENINIDVVDQNDNTPYFLSKIRQINVYEDSKSERAEVNFTIIQFKAFDKDTDLNAKLKFSIVSNDPLVKETLKIDPDLGILSSHGTLDKEKFDRLNFKVLVSDQGQPPKSSELDFQLDIEDYNDHAPRFSEMTRYSFQICENRPPNELVGVMLANDLDSGENGLLKFQIDTMNDKLPFQLFPEKIKNYKKNNNKIPLYQYRIEIRSTSKLDRESIIAMSQIYPKYDFIVTAEDYGLPRLNHRIAVQIDVLDENDQAPIFDLPTRNLSTISLSYFESSNYKFAKIGANDQDEGLNGTIRYLIKQGDPELKFHLDPESGDLRLAKKLTSMDCRDYQLLIEAKDMGAPPKSNTIQIVIRVDGSPPLGQQYDLNSPSMDAMNLYIIIAIVVASFIISVILLIAICVVLQKSKSRSHTYPSKFQTGLLPSNDLYPGIGDLSIPNYHTHTSNMSPTGSFNMLPLTHDNMINSENYLLPNGNYPKFEAPHSDIYRIMNPSYQPFCIEEILNNNDKDSGKGDSVDARFLYQQLDQGKHYGYFDNTIPLTGSMSSPRDAGCSTPSSYDICTLRRPLISFCKAEKSTIEHQVGTDKTHDFKVISNMNNGSFV